eukprot:SAG11_NODE_120_length_15879_cov_8.076933_6_plen_107_part_00
MLARLREHLNRPATWSWRGSRLPRRWLGRLTGRLATIPPGWARDAGEGARPIVSSEVQPAESGEPADRRSGDEPAHAVPVELQLLQRGELPHAGRQGSGQVARAER